MRDPPGSTGEPNKPSHRQFGGAALLGTLPAGGGANTVIGIGHPTVPTAVRTSRRGFGPLVTVTYDSQHGDSLFGLEWTLSAPSFPRHTPSISSPIQRHRRLGHFDPVGCRGFGGSSHARCARTKGCGPIRRADYVFTPYFTSRGAKTPRAPVVPVACSQFKKEIPWLFIIFFSK